MLFCRLQLPPRTHIRSALHKHFHVPQSANCSSPPAAPRQGNPIGADTEACSASHRSLPAPTSTRPNTECSCPPPYARGCIPCSTGCPLWSYIGCPCPIATGCPPISACMASCSRASPGGGCAGSAGRGGWWWPWGTSISEAGGGGGWPAANRGEGLSPVNISAALSGASRAQPAQPGMKEYDVAAKGNVRQGAVGWAAQAWLHGLKDELGSGAESP